MSTQGDCPGPKAVGKLQLENVCFKYPRRSDLNVLKYVNMTVQLEQLVNLNSIYCRPSVNCWDALFSFRPNLGWNCRRQFVWKEYNPAINAPTIWPYGGLREQKTISSDGVTVFNFLCHKFNFYSICRFTLMVGSWNLLMLVGFAPKLGTSHKSQCKWLKSRLDFIKSEWRRF